MDHYILFIENESFDTESLSFLELLIKSGANVNVADKGGITPLIVAARHGNSVYVLLFYWLKI